MPQISFASFTTFKTQTNTESTHQYYYAVTGGASLFGVIPETGRLMMHSLATYMFIDNQHSVREYFTSMLGPNGEYLILSLANLGPDKTELVHAGMELIKTVGTTTIQANPHRHQ